ncbi:hypothetical protein JYU34_018443, partial [Plutella xylostella]
MRLQPNFSSQLPVQCPLPTFRRAARGGGVACPGVVCQPRVTGTTPRIHHDLRGPGGGQRGERGTRPSDIAGR